MVKFRKIFLFFVIVLLLSFGVFAQSPDRIDSDGDGISDSHDNCPNTNPDEGLPIILRNPEFLGCSCSQIFKLMDNEYCRDIYCFSGRPLEIKYRSFSSRPNPCPPPRCEGDTLFTYVVDSIRCHQGNELPYECEEIIVEDSEICIEGLLENNSFFVDDDVVARDIFDVIVLSYLEESRFVEIFNIKSRNELINNNRDVLKKINVERSVSLNERIINNRPILVADISLIVTPNSFSTVKDFVLVEQVLGDLSDKNIIINGEYFYDPASQIIVWELDSLNDEVIFTYRITPGHNLDFNYFVQGKSESSVFKNLVLPLLLLTIVIGMVVFWFITMKEKSKVFKN